VIDYKSVDRDRLHQPCSYPQQEPYSIEATARRCGDDRSSRLPSLDSHLPEQRSLRGDDARLQLASPMATTTRAISTLDSEPAAQLQNRRSGSTGVSRNDTPQLHPCPPRTTKVRYHRQHRASIGPSKWTARYLQKQPIEVQRGRLIECPVKIAIATTN
jgi:hypothetical protein